MMKAQTKLVTAEGVRNGPILVIFSRETQQNLLTVGIQGPRQREEAMMTVTLGEA